MTTDLLAAEAGEVRADNGTPGKGENMRSGGQNRHLPSAHAGREPKKHHAPKTEEGGDFREKKTGRVKAAKGLRTAILD